MFCVGALNTQPILTVGALGGSENYGGLRDVGIVLSVSGLQGEPTFNRVAAYRAGGGRAAMRKLEITYVNEGEETKEWRSRFVALLSKGVYEYLKRTGQLRRDTTLCERARQVLNQARRLTERDESS